MREEREWREKLQTSQKTTNEKINLLQQKITQLQKQNASLSKTSKKGSLISSTINNNLFDTDIKDNSNNANNGSKNVTPNDSPI